MTMPTKPARVDREGERLYLYAPGEVCVDICSGAKTERSAAMDLLVDALRKVGVQVVDTSDR